MKCIHLSWLISLLICAACTVPTASDFQSPDRPLATDEVIAIWRFTHEAKISEVLDSSPEHSAALEAQMDPLFQQIIPRIFSDLKDGKLVLREENDIANLDEQPITDLPGRMDDLFGSSWQNLGPYMGAFHVTQRRRATTKGFKGEELELMLIAQDPGGTLPERYIGSVRFADLLALGYTIEIGEKSYDLQTYLAQSIEFAYPIHYRTTEMAAGLYTLEQAFATKKLLMNGAWSDIEWLGREPNLSGKKVQNLTVPELKAYAGTYAVESIEGLDLPHTEDLKLELVVEENYLMVDMPFRGPYYRYLLFPSGGNEFFTVNGDLLQFSFDSREDLSFVFEDVNGVKILGKKK
ncbi:MAG: hypothetical protein AAF587_08500 [Bacteroidota bacterium]